LKKLRIKYDKESLNSLFESNLENLKYILDKWINLFLIERKKFFITNRLESTYKNLLIEINEEYKNKKEENA